MDANSSSRTRQRGRGASYMTAWYPRRSARAPRVTLTPVQHNSVARRPHMRRFSRLALLLVVLLPAAVFAQSQATTGVIEGTVVDASGAALPGVTVTIHNTATNYEQQAITDSGGRFRAVLLPLGPYEVTAMLEGFAKSMQRGVVVADGANAEFGRSQSGFVNVITKSGTNDLHGTAHFVSKPDSLASRAKNPNGTLAPDFNSNQNQYGFTVGGPLVRDKVFYFGALDIQKADSTKQSDPSRIEQRVVDALAKLGSPDENGPIKRTNDARVLLAKTDWNISSRNLATLRYNYTWSEQKNGTFDVDSWGRSANSIEKDSSHAGTGSLITTFSNSLLNEFRFQFARENRPRPYNGPLITGQSRPLPDTAFDFAKGYRFGEPFFIPVKYYDTRVQFNNNVSFLRGAHSIKGGVEYNRVNSVQTFVGFANGRYIFDSTAGFLHYARNS